MLNIGSDLYVETLYLKKSMNHIETITASGFELYQRLKAQGQRAESIQALHIAQEIHEVKRIHNVYTLVFQKLLVKETLILL